MKELSATFINCSESEGGGPGGQQMYTMHDFGTSPESHVCLILDN